MMREVEQFLQQLQRPNPLPSVRVLATVLAVAAPPQPQPQPQPQPHRDQIRHLLAIGGGRITAAAGDDSTIVALFDAPSSALRCARTIFSKVATPDLRAATHVGEFDTAAMDKPGVEPIATARALLDAARAGEIVASDPVCALAPAADFAFAAAAERAGVRLLIAPELERVRANA